MLSVLIVSYAKATFDSEAAAADVIKAFNGLKLNDNEVKAEVARARRQSSSPQRSVSLVECLYLCLGPAGQEMPTC